MQNRRIRNALWGFPLDYTFGVIGYSSINVNVVQVQFQTFTWRMNPDA